MKPNIDSVMMKTAINFASLSYAKRKKVGAVLSRNGRIIACGYNGTIPGADNNCEEECPHCHGTGFRHQMLEFGGETEIGCSKCGGTGLVTSEFVLHAEQNILTFCNRQGLKTDSCKLYVTMAPCKTCSKLIVSAGITKVFYNEVYRDMSGIEFLNKMNIETEKI